MFKKLRKNEKGFTLAELLIVVAIIGVLVAISIPIFTAQLEKAKEATDMANIRSAYAEVIAGYLSDDTTDHQVTVTIKSSVKDWKTAGDPTLGGVKYETLVNTEGAKGSVVVKADKDGKVTIGTQEIKSDTSDGAAGNVAG